MKTAPTLIISIASLALLACSGVLVHKPKIVTLEVSADRLGPDDEVEFIAFVTDPEGDANVLAGVLSDPETGSVYGNFSKAGVDWTLSLASADIAFVLPFSFQSEQERIFEAVFYDRDGHESKPVAVAVTVHCDGHPTCDGACAKVETDESNCGTCGNRCGPYLAYTDDGPTEQSAQCQGGFCVVPAECTSDVRATCNKFCEVQGFSGCPDLPGPVGLIFDAEPDSCTGDLVDGALVYDCSERHPDDQDFGWMTCLCLE